MPDIIRQIRDLKSEICCLEKEIKNIQINGGGGTAVVHPSYVPPTLVLSATGDTEGEYESGEEINPILNRTFNQNDAGALTGSTLVRTPGGTISASFPYTDVDYQVVDGDTQYQATANYAAGPVKNNNLGNPDPTGQIGAGAITSNILHYIGVRAVFYEGITTAIPASSVAVRALTGVQLDPANNDFTIDIPMGTVHVIFAIPDTLIVDSVEYLEFGNADVKALFDTSSVTVEGANAYSPIGYTVYSYTPIEPFTSEVHYKVATH